MKLKNSDILKCTLTIDEIADITTFSISKTIPAKNIAFGNKVISAKKGNISNYYISLYREVFYRLKNNVYIPLTDLSFFEVLTENKELSEEEFNEFIESYIIECPSSPLMESTPENNGVYIANIEPISEFGIDKERLNYKELIHHIKSINNYISKYTRKNLQNGTFDEKNISKKYIISGNNEFNNVLDALAQDENGISLTKKYAAKKRIF